MGISQTSNQPFQQSSGAMNEETVDGTPEIKQRSSNLLRNGEGNGQSHTGSRLSILRNKVTESMLPNSENIAYNVETYIHSTKYKATIQEFSNMVKLKTQNQSIKQKNPLYYSCAYQSRKGSSWVGGCGGAHL